MSDGTPFIPPLPSTPHHQQSNLARTPYNDPRSLPPNSAHLGPQQWGDPYVYHSPNPTSAAGTPFIPLPAGLPQNPSHSSSSGSDDPHAHDPRYVPVSNAAGRPAYVVRGSYSSDYNAAGPSNPRSPGSESTTSWGTPSPNPGPWDAAASSPSGRGNAAGPPPLPPPQQQNPYHPFGPPPAGYIPNPYAAAAPQTPFTPYGARGPWPSPASSASSYTPWGAPPASLPGPWGGPQQAHAAATPFAAPPMSPWGQPPPAQYPAQYTPFMPPPQQQAPWGGQPGPWGPQQPPPGPWGMQAPPQPPPPQAVDRTAGRPLMKANQAPVGDRVPKWSEGSHYGPVLMSAEAHILEVQFEINPLLLPPDDSATEYLKWDMVFETNYCYLTTDPATVSWQRGRNQPATFPRVQSLRLVSRLLPYSIDVHTSHLDVGVTCGEVIETIGRVLHEKASQSEYEARLPRDRQHQVALSYHRNRSREPDVPGGRLSSGLLKLDVLGRNSMFGGIKLDAAFARAACGADMPATFELVCGRKLISSEKELEDRLNAATAATANLSVHSRPPSANSAGSRRSHSAHSKRRSRNVTVESPTDSES